MLVFLSINAQNNASEINIGDKLIIGKLTNGTFQSITLPKRNFIVKRGGIANYKSVENNIVVVTNIEKDKNGNTIVELKRNNGKRFFNTHKTIKANLQEALDSGELKTQ
ncbi:MAG: hypothetical protein HKO92_10985 [Flavobacteriaceae bacterium]|nr:hypothetical protein [Flavobacteriaceae bacterium]